MPNSQIDMVVRDEDQVGWNVCGDVEALPGQPDARVDIYVVVRQGDVIARGHKVVPFGSWQFPVVVDGGQLDAGPGRTAIASAVAITQEHPSGLESFTWAQRIPVLPVRPAGGEGDSSSHFGPAETVSGPGQLAFGMSISSSLTVKEPATAGSGDGTLSWEHALQIR
jgi:hypothetical protein